MVGITSREILDAVVLRWALIESREMILRGSYVLGEWVGVGRRPADDVDFLARFRFDPVQATLLVKDALARECADGIIFATDGAKVSTLFADSEFPGVRVCIPWNRGNANGEAQIDIGFGDPLPLGTDDWRPVFAPHHALAIAPPASAFAWKLHGLFEFSGFSWRSKDLADLWLMTQYMSLRSQDLAVTIKAAFVSRDAPLWRMQRLLSRQLGRSSTSRRQWKKLQRQWQGAELPPLATCVEQVAQVVESVGLSWDRPGSWLEAVDEADLVAAAHTANGLNCYERENGWRVYVAEHGQDKCNPLAAASEREHKQQLALREARGITFSTAGKLLSRPYAGFCSPKEAVSGFANAEVLEKLDGSLVFPTPTPYGYRWRTRRGPSEIGDAAAAFASRAPAHYDGLIAHCLARNITPLFEWCSRSRIIVLDHPKDRLVLTGARRNHDGLLLTYAQLRALADPFAVEIVKKLDAPPTLDALVAQVTKWRGREGVVVRSADGHQCKIKSNQYRLLHRALEGPHRDRARWQLWATQETHVLEAASRRRDIDLQSYLKALTAASQRVAIQVTEVLTQFPGDRRGLALHLRETDTLLATIYFRAAEGTPVKRAIRQLVLRCCETSAQFQRMAKALGGPRRDDG